MALGDSIKAFFSNPFVQQFGLLILWGLVAFGVANYFNEGGELTNAIGSAASVILLITLIALPVSYMMNYLMYHSRAMRFGVGGLALFMGPLVWLFVVVRSTGAVLGLWDKYPYFGMFPLFEQGAQVEPAKEEGGWLSAFNMFWDQITFLFRYRSGENEKYMKPLLAPYIAPDTEHTVPDSLYAAAREIAKQSALDAEKVLGLPPERQAAETVRLATDRAAARAALVP
jgi:hypothetical protein